MNLIPEAKQAFKLTSVQAAALLTILSMVQLQVLPLIEPLMPAEWWPWVTMFFGLAIIVCRLIAQPGITVPSDSQAGGK